MAVGPAGATVDRAGWGLARPATDARTRVRLAVGLVAVLVVALASLALLNSFFVELAPGQPDPQPGGGNDGEETDPGADGEGGGGGEGPTCEKFERFFYWTFIVLAVIAVGFFAVAVVRREKSGGKIGASVWGILAVVAAFLSVLAYGAYKVIGVLCDGDLTCGSANDGTYSSFILLLVLTLGSLALGIGFAHAGRRNFLTTGWGLLGLLMYFPTVIVGFTWFIIRTGCTPDLSCALRDQFLEQLAWIFWLSVAAMVIAVAIGIFVQKRWAHGFFRSGWGVLAILAALLAAFAGSGYLFVDSIKIPGCDTFEVEEPEEKTCEEVRDEAQDRILTGVWWVAGLSAASVVAGLIVHRSDLKRFWGSPFAIVAYIGLVLLVLLGLLYMLAGSLCGEGDDGRGDGDGNNGDGNDGSGDGGGGDAGDGGGSPGGGSPGGNQPGGGGPGSGPGGGGGGIGSANPVTTPVVLDPSALSWVFIALLVIIGIAVLVVLLRFRKEKGWAGEGGPAPAEQESVQARERRDLLAMLEQGKLSSSDAVIAAYRAFVAWSAARGMGLQNPETPREHAERVGAKYALPRESMHEFIAAYEVARLSSRLPTDEERTQAVRFTRELSRPVGGAAPPEGPT